MNAYALRFFFDYGSGVCLWSANDVTRARFGYPVNIAQLPVSDELKARVEQLIAKYDTSLNWADPGGESLWNDEQWRQFDTEAYLLFTLIQEELQGSFMIINEHLQT